MVGPGQKCLSQFVRLIKAWAVLAASMLCAEAFAAQHPSRVDRSPVDLALTPDETWLVTVNQTSNSISLVGTDDGRIADEEPCGQRPSAIAISPDGSRVVVSATYGGTMELFNLAGEDLRPAGRVYLGFEPRGVAIDPAGAIAYVALTRSNEVAVVDLNHLRILARIEVAQWPRYLALSPDGKRLAVGCSGAGGISVVDTTARMRLYDSTFQGLNIGHLRISADGQYAYFPWMVYADRPITPGNIREGWVLGNRLARVRLDGPARREAIALDPRGRGVADPHGMALTADGRRLALTASGTHEVVVFAMDDLPLRPDGPGDHLPGELSQHADRMLRIDVGGRPMGVCFAASGERMYVANYLANSVQVVSLAKRGIEREMPLGGSPDPSLARRGEQIFHDARRSLDGWFSCHSCHYEGGGNAVTMDTNNDGSAGTYKMVLSLRDSSRTGPWFWHGWQNDFRAAVGRSLVDTMQGPKPSDDEVDAVVAYLEGMSQPPNSWRRDDGQLDPQAERGRLVFESAAAGCANCHSGAYLTDGQVHDVGLGSRFDKYQGFNTPALQELVNRAGYLHHGRAKSLEELLVDLHDPAKVSGTRALEPRELADLVAYLRTL